MPLAELAREALRLEGSPPESILRQLSDLLEADARFRRAGDGSFALSQWDRDQLPLEEVEFVVFDVETNGGRSGRHRIIELGAVKIRGGSEIGSYQSLVQLRRRLPKFISNLTGIQVEMLHDAPPIGSVLVEFGRFSQGAILVAHNLPADLAYLNHEAMWADLPYFPSDGLDTMELSALLLPQMRQPSLADALARVGRAEPPVHRALPDARSTAELFRRILGLARDRGALDLTGLRRIASAGPEDATLPRRSAELARWCSLNLPALPGVYVFRDRQGAALYVGKSTSLQRRVRSHFTGQRGYVQKWRGLLDATERIDHEVTGSEFAALLREIELIAEAKPIHNVQMERRSAARIVRLGPLDDPVVGCVSNVAADGAVYAGPYRTGNGATAMAATVRRVFELPSRRRRFPVESPASRSAAEVFLLRGPDEALRYLESIAPEEGLRAEIAMRRLRRLRRTSRPIPGGLAGARAVVFDHGPKPGHIEFFLIDQGAVVSRRCALEPARRHVRALLADFLQESVAAVASDPSSVNLVLAWLHQHFGDLNLLVVRPDDSPQALLSRAWRQVSLLKRF